MRQERSNDDNGGGQHDADQTDVAPAESESADDRHASPDFPEVPGRDIGPAGTVDVDPPPNTESEYSQGIVEPPD